MRLEVTVRDMGEIDEIAAFLSAQKLRKINVNHVWSKVDPIAVARELLVRVPDLDIIVYLSIKHFAKSSLDDARGAFRAALEDARKLRINRVLVVSGHPRQPFDTIDALHMIQVYGLAKEIDIYCAYNPFFDPARLRDENERLKQKIAYPFVKAICLQIGMDTEKLRKAVETIRALRPDLTLYGDIPVPSEGTINRLKLAALHGVFLPNSYFLSAETAKEMTRSLVDAYAAHGVEPAIFSAHLSDVEDALPMFV